MTDLKLAARFIEPMLLLPAEKLPDGASWTYELKLDGYRAEAIESRGRVQAAVAQRQGFRLGGRLQGSERPVPANPAWTFAHS